MFLASCAVGSFVVFGLARAHLPAKAAGAHTEYDHVALASDKMLPADTAPPPSAVSAGSILSPSPPPGPGAPRLRMTETVESEAAGSQPEVTPSQPEADASDGDSVEQGLLAGLRAADGTGDDGAAPASEQAQAGTASAASPRLTTLTEPFTFVTVHGSNKAEIQDNLMKSQVHA